MVYLTNTYDRNDNNIQNFTVWYCYLYHKGRPDFVSSIELQDIQKIKQQQQGTFLIFLCCKTNKHNHNLFIVAILQYGHKLEFMVALPTIHFVFR